MKNHLHYIEIRNHEITNEMAKVCDLQYFLKEDNELDKLIGTIFPLFSDWRFTG